MTFKWFKKYEKPILWVTVVFTVLIFATFSGFDDLQRMMGPDEPDVAGSFRVATTGETETVGVQEFAQIRRSYGRLFGGRAEINDDMVWSHIMLVADAEGAGIEVSDGEVAELAQAIVAQGQPIAKADYRNLVLQRLQFSSLRAFEDFLRQVRLAERWQEVLSLEAGVVTADEAYKRWSIDNEVFDFDALSFPDLDPETIPDPGDEVLRAYFDAMSEISRKRLFFEPARQDIVYGWIAFDADLSQVPGDVLAALPEPGEADIVQRFARVRSVRYPDIEELDDATRAALRTELMTINLAGAAHRAFLGEATKDKATFVASMEANGLAVVDPEGKLGPEELEALEIIGSPLLSGRLRGTEAGMVRYVPSFSADDSLAMILFVEDLDAERPLAFEEGRDQVLAAWRKDHVAAAANDFRAALTAAAQLLPEAQEAIAPLEQGAREAAEAIIASSADELDEAAKQAILDDELAGVQALIDARLSEFVGQVWDAQVALLPDAQLTSFTDVSKNRTKHLEDGDATDTTTLDYFLKTNPYIFQQDIGAVTPVLRHNPTKQSVIVRVTGRRMLPMSDMLADEKGMQSARQLLGYQRRSQFQQDGLEPAALIASHELFIPVYEKPEIDTED